MARRSTRKQRRLKKDAREHPAELDTPLAPEISAAVDEPTSLSGAWQVLGWVGAFIATTVAQKGLSAFWRSATGRKPPSNPADPSVDLTEAVTWVAGSAAVAALAKMLATRRATRYYLRSTSQPESRA